MTSFPSTASSRDRERAPALHARPRTRSANSESPSGKASAFSRHIPIWSARRRAMMSSIELLADPRDQPPHRRVRPFLLVVEHVVGDEVGDVPDDGVGKLQPHQDLLAPSPRTPSRGRRTWVGRRAPRSRAGACRRRGGAPPGAGPGTRAGPRRRHTANA